MKAARFYAAEDIRIDDIPEPELRPGAVMVDIAWNGICGSDLHEYLEGPIFVPAPGHPHPITGEELPVTMGHEFSGTISALGEGVTDLQIGQSVVVEPYIIRDDVSMEPGEEYQLSPDTNFVGLAGRGGGLSEKVVADRKWIHPVGDIPLDQAALIEPLAVSHHAFTRSGAKAGQVALIGGAGPIGLLTAAVLKAEGLTVIVSEISAVRKEKATTTGVADHVFDPTEVNVAEEVRKITNGKGADVAFECSSVNPVLDMLVDAVKPTGTIVNVSIWGRPATIDMVKIVTKEIALIGTMAYAHDHPAVIKLVQDGKIKLEPFITSRIALDDVVEEGFKRLINNNETEVKILVHP
ncbi:2,3-butanediol dehydrogenase [Cryobacterium sp. M91]|jgi:(R,R)-butanediol dehydrogenase/meso-butanediol dehydrogenase/diacetyl reductase|uniref:2,3-butanediol dehydrogenase n=1 Tax=Cryobacterium sp. M91 TaxID=2048294 RepID=UPI000CE4EBEA|nr:2,3-butanediol dehydrogenase [Cryobacterium sp. M91]